VVKQVIRVPAILNDGAHRPVQEAIRRANANFTEIYDRAVSVKDFGAVGDGVTDDTAAFKAAITAAQVFTSSHIIYVPVGVYIITECLSINDRIMIEGNPGFHYFASFSVLQFPSGCCGIVIHSSDTTCDSLGYNQTTKTPSQRPDGSTITGQGTRIRNLRVRFGPDNQAKPTPDGVTHGIRLRASAHLENTYCHHWAGNGIHIEANIAGVGAARGDANQFRLDNTFCQGNAGNGIFVQGNDVNAGVGIMCNCTHNDGYGIYDSSFLGNTWIGCHTSTNDLGPYKSDNVNAHTVFLGCYAELGQPPCEMTDPATNAYGLQSPLTTGSGFRIAGKYRSGGQVYTADDFVTTSVVSIRPYGTDHVILRGRFGTQTTAGTQLFDYDTTTGSYFIGREGTDASAYAASITTLDTVGQFGRGTQVTSGQLHSKGIYIGNGHTNARYVSSQATVPSTGTHAIGEVYLNTAGDEPPFWRCTVAGTPGTWQPSWGDWVTMGAADGTPAISSGTRFKTGGTTTITDFDQARAGQMITVLAQHTVTITHGTNIFLRGSVNFDMTIGDTLTLIQNSDTFWYEVSRSEL
jgi:hypothetical protein